MPARVLFLGFDSMSASLTERWAAAGHLPAFAALRARSRAFSLANYMDSLPGSIWTDIPTGRPPSVHGQFYHPSQYFSAEGALRQLEETDFDPDLYLWSDCHRAGLRSAVIDVPFLVFQDGFSGVQIRDFASHDVLYGFRAEPAERYGDLPRRYGPIPVHGEMCDALAERVGGRGVREGLLRRADIKTDLLVDLLAEEWDLFYAVYGETHCASHYSWPHAEGDGIDDFGPLLEIYRRMDEGLARVLDAAGPEAQVVVTLSHGTGPYIGGPQLLPEVLNRLGWTTGADSAWRARLRTGLTEAAQRLPSRIRKPLRALAGGGKGRIEGLLGRTHQPFAHPGCRAAAVWNNRCGAIRFNVAGRDPQGTLPAAELDRAAAELSRQLLALRDPRDGSPLVAGVEWIADLFPEPHHPELPDLVVRFRANLGPLEACEVPGIGTIRIPLRRPDYGRTGDHTPENRTYVSAGGQAAGGVEKGSVLDIAPTVLSLCGVAPPADMPGRPLGADAGSGRAMPRDEAGRGRQAFRETLDWSRVR